MTVMRAFALFFLLVPAAAAAEPIYPKALRVGLVPPPGMVLSQTFSGFEDVERQVAIALNELPPMAYHDIENSIFSDSPNQPVVVEKRELLPLEAGMGFLIAGHQEIAGVRLRKWLLLTLVPGMAVVVSAQMPQAALETYPETAIRAALASLTVRPPPIEEQLDLLPFRMSEMAGFRVYRAMPGGAAMLTEGPSVDDFVAQPHLVISIGQGGPQPADRSGFAQKLFAVPPGLKDVKLVASEAMRIGSHFGHEVQAEGTDVRTGARVGIVQWVRFGSGGGGYLRMVGLANKEVWPQVFARFRAVRDGVEPR